jgi:hypothetical protein
MWMVSWIESGTGERRTEGPFETEERARGEASRKLYPPIRATIQVWRKADAQVS